MNPCQANLLHLLRSLDALSAAIVPFKRTLHRFVLEHGWWYEPVELPERFDLGTPKQCHKNATTLALAVCQQAEHEDAVPSVYDSGGSVWI